MDDCILSAPTEQIPNDGKSLGAIFYSVLREKREDSTIILVDENSKISYTNANIYERSVRTASCLYEFGVRRNDVVGILAVNSVDYIWTVLGCFYLGATIHPLNPDYLKREISHTFEISKPKFVIADTDKMEFIFEATSHLEEVPKLMTFGDFYSNEDTLETLDKKLHISTEDPTTHVAVILCSSGTTGLPKGVAITDEAIKYCFHHVKYLIGNNISSQASVLAILPFYHMFGLLLAMGYVLYGCKTVILRKFKPDVFVKALEVHQITQLYIVPPIALFLAQTSLVFNAISLKDVFCGAAPLPREVQLKLEARLGVKLRQLYGMTEVCAIAISPPEGSPLGSTGKLVDNVKAKFVDIDTGIPLGPNQRGELCVLTPCAMKCYVNNEKATKESFDSQGYLHTGDIGYYDEQGFIYIVDRLKELIKYKGFQVSPAELEDILMAHPEIKDAAVVGVRDERAGEKAKAYVVKLDDSCLTEEAVQAYVAKQVSNAKWLHGGVEFIDAIPKSAPGKILRRELRVLAAVK